MIKKVRSIPKHLTTRNILGCNVMSSTTLWYDLYIQIRFTFVYRVGCHCHTFPFDSECDSCDESFRSYYNLKDYEKKIH